MSVNKYGLAIFATASLVSTFALAVEVKTEAVIISISDTGISARTKEGPLTVVLTPATKIEEETGPISRKTRDAKSLIPGLIIKVKGDQQGETVTADSVNFKQRDWRAAVTTKAGTTEEFAKTNEQVSELRQAIIDGQEYVIREEGTVYFATGSATVAEEYKQGLRTLAEKAPSYGNYRISILGFTDPHGNPEANERLSKRRADAVNNFLRQTMLIEPGRVLSPSAMGEGTAAPGEAAPTSDEEARRVVVRVITAKGQLTK